MRQSDRASFAPALPCARLSSRRTVAARRPRGVPAMTPDPREVLSALIDREAVDPDALAIVLEQAAHRHLLVDFVRLRVAMSESPAGAPQVMSPPPARRRPWRTAAAALVLAGMSAAAGA